MVRISFLLDYLICVRLNYLARSASYKPEMFACLVVSQFNFSHVFNYYFHVHEKIRCEVSKIEFESVSRCAFYSALL